jgi:[ribosomal protein S5]-alanine N-acetyltransferase
MASDRQVLTERLACRPTEPGDLSGYESVLLDPHVEVRLRPASAPPMDGRRVRERLDADLAHWEEHGFGPWTLVQRDTGFVIGRGGLQWAATEDREVVELPWAVVSQHWNRGFATEAAGAALAWARQLELLEAVALVTPDNDPSRRVAEKIGMRVEGRTVHGGLPHLIYRALLV